MKVETKFEIGQKVWNVWKDESWSIFSAGVIMDEIVEVIITEKGIQYYLGNCDEPISEDEIIAYENTDKLLEKIKEVAKECEKDNEGK